MLEIILLVLSLIILGFSAGPLVYAFLTNSMSTFKNVWLGGVILFASATLLYDIWRKSQRRFQTMTTNYSRRLESYIPREGTLIAIILLYLTLMYLKIQFLSPYKHMDEKSILMVILVIIILFMIFRPRHFETTYIVNERKPQRYWNRRYRRRRGRYYH